MSKGMQIERMQGIQWGDQIKDSSLYFDGHTLFADVVGTGAGLAAFKVRAINPANNAPTDVWTVNKDGQFVLAGLQLGTGVVTPFTQLLSVNKSVSNPSGTTVLMDVILDTASTTPADEGALRTVARQSASGNAMIRAFESHVIRDGSATSGLTWAQEIGVHSSVVGNTAVYNVGLYVASSHTGWISGTPVRNDTAVLILGEDGWYHGIRYYDTDQVYVLFDVDQYGLVSAAGGVQITGLVNRAATQYGVHSAPTFGSTVTGTGVGVRAAVQSQAAAFTVTNVYTLQAGGPTLGAGSAMTNVTGLRVENQGVTGVTNAIGVDIAAQSGAATTNLGLRNLGTTHLGGTVGVLGVPRAHTAVYVNGTSIPGSGGNAQGVYSQASYASDVTGTGTGVQGKITTDAASFTMTGAIALSALGPTLGAGSAITTATGLSVSNQGATGVTNAIGVDIAAQSGAATLNIGLRNNGTTLLNGNVGFNGTSPIAKPTVTGSRGANAALASLLTALANYGLVTDSSSA